MIVRPFRGWRPRADLAAKIPSVPYDVVNRREARELTAGNLQSFLHIVRADAGMSDEVDPHDTEVYRRARQNLESFIDRGWLQRDPAPTYYIYRLEMNGRVQTGLLGAAAVQDYNEGRIKKHEHTRPVKEEDRIRLNDTLGAHPGPVFLTHRRFAQLDDRVEQLARATPDVDFTAPDGVRHTLWIVGGSNDCVAIEQAFAAIPATYVADGHHRTAAAAKVGASRLERRIEAGQTPTGDEPFQFFLAVHFPSDELHVLDYNRVVRDLDGWTPDELLQQIEVAGFRIRPNHQDVRSAPRRGTFGIYLDGRWLLLEAATKWIENPDVVERLDVSILTERLLQPLLGIGDPRVDERIDFVGGIRGMDELERRVNSGRDAVAFSLYPTSLDEVMDVADAGRVMPPKSTWFEPKLRSGMVLQSIEGDEL